MYLILEQHINSSGTEKLNKEEKGKLQVNNASSFKSLAGGYEGKLKTQKELVEELKVQWKLLWSERYNDKLRAEGISVKDYASLRVERGTIIHATRDYKALSFKEILEQNLIENPDRFVQPDAQAGGWNKFVKTKISIYKLQRKELSLSFDLKKQGAQQPKKGGRGWLHVT